MTAYFLLLLLPSAFALSHRHRVDKTALFFVFLVFVIFVGLRYRVGADWFGYEWIHNSLRYQTFGEVLTQQEPLSHALFWLSEKSGQGMLISNLVAAVILLVGVFAFARRTVNPWLAIVAATPYLIIAFGMSGIRQAMGVGVVLFLLSRWEKIGAVVRGAGIVVASLFHTSALFTGLLVILTSKGRLALKVFGSVFFAGIALYLIGSVDIYADAFQQFDSRYLENPDAVYSGGSLFHIGLVVIPALLALSFRRRLIGYVPNHQLLMLGALGACLLLAVNVVSTTVASRLTLYLYFVPMATYPGITWCFGQRNKVSLTVMLIVFHFAVLAIWLVYGNNSFAHVPYDNVLLRGL